MVKNRRHDEKLIELFNELPEIKDHRSMNEIYSNVMDRLNRTEHRKQRRFLIPAFATATMLFLSGILIMSIIRFPGGNLSIDQKSEDIHTESFDYSNGRQLFHSNNLEDRSEQDKIESPFETIALYQNMIGEDEHAITLYIPDKNVQNMIPITVLAKQAADQPLLDVFLDVYDRIDEQALGLSDFYPYEGSISADDDGNVTIDLSSNMKGNWGSTGEVMFMESLESFQSLNLDFVYLYEDGSPGLFFPHTGLEIFKYELGKNEQHYPYFIYRTDHHQFLTYGPETYADISEALTEMKNNIDIYDLEASIPMEMEFTVKVGENGWLILQFSNEPIDLDSKSILTMIEAILLTAKSFGYSGVKFENLSVKENIGFDLDQPIQVPIAPNLIELDEDFFQTDETVN
ncbi:hypothetical protein [Fervidibacillus halotolerans]|uniref:GerMN domain-containing protein n=1 Tax=Fervidibacillus halotolerans TaxID=2980027 RepID=A0A9E8M1L6_9BACI|nr:hypothetical protein [Fervidibacillus halotolerans]WAA13795.1 hypothetical protein OE105_06770 [Fervidibacillus halotolerans]